MAILKFFAAIIFSIGNLFLSTYVLLCTYEWYSPHVGFELPQLDYWNLFAINFIISILFLLPNRDILIYEIWNASIPSDEKGSKFTPASVTIFLLIILFSAWAYKTIFF